MKFTAKYLDSGFYTISDKAAGAISNGNLPRKGYTKVACEIKTKDRLTPMHVNLVRSSTSSLNKRGWKWAIHALPYQGKDFQFET